MHVVPEEISLSSQLKKEEERSQRILTDAESAVRCPFSNTGHAVALSALAHSYPHSLAHLLNLPSQSLGVSKFTHSNFPDGCCGVADIMNSTLYCTLMASPICQLRVNHADFVALRFTA
jgi:hypothetical protein